jgi:uncharacterized membrane protein YgdD (TMEM256/DUF423 family)
VALLAVRDEITIQWLGGDPTRIFALPAIVIFAIGGASFIALIALITKSARGSIAAMVPGVLLAGSIAVEVLILRRDSHIPTPIGIVYFMLGFFLVALAVLLRRQSATIGLRPTQRPA